MRKKTLLMLLPALLFLGVSPSTAISPQEKKPVTIVSIASYDQLLESVELVGKLAGKPKLAKGLRGSVAVLTQGRGLDGLSTTRPMAIVLWPESPGLGGYACLPTDDPAAFLEVLEPLVEKIEDLGDGIYRVQGKGPRQVGFIKVQGERWLFVSDKRERLTNTPNDPADMLAELAGQRDIVVRLNLGSLPTGEREKLLAAIDQQAGASLQQRPGEGDGEYAIRKIMTVDVIAMVRKLAGQIDTVTLGWSLDKNTHRVSLDVAVTALPGSEAAEAFARLAEAKTDFAGFLLPDAVLSGHATATIPSVSPGNLDNLFGAIRSKAFSDIDAKESSSNQAELDKEIVGEILDVVQKTLASGQLDGATSLVANTGGATFIAGRHVADGPKLEEAFRRFVAAYREQHPVHAEQVLKTDVGELHGVGLHQALLDVPRDATNRDRVVQLVGQRLEVAIGFGPQSVYLAAGRDAFAALQRAIEASAAGPKSVSPMEMSISLGRFAQLVSETGESPAKEQAVMMLDALQHAGSDDHVRLVASPEENGVRFSLVFEAEVLRMFEAINKE